MGFSQAQRYGVVKEGLDEQFGKQTMLPRRVDGGPMRSFLLWKSRRQKRDGLRGSWRSCLRRRPGRIGMSWAGEKGPGWKRGARNSRNAFWFDDSEYFDAIAQDEECRWRRRMRPSARARHRMAVVANAHVTATARPARHGRRRVQPGSGRWPRDSIYCRPRDLETRQPPSTPVPSLLKAVLSAVLPRDSPGLAGTTG